MTPQHRNMGHQLRGTPPAHGRGQGVTVVSLQGAALHLSSPSRLLGTRGDGDRRLRPLHRDGPVIYPAFMQTRAGRELLVASPCLLMVRVCSNQHLPGTGNGARPSHVERKDGAHRDREGGPPAQPRSHSECGGSTGSREEHWGSVLSCATGNQQSRSDLSPGRCGLISCHPNRTALEESGTNAKPDGSLHAGWRPATMKGATSPVPGPVSHEPGHSMVSKLGG